MTKPDRPLATRQEVADYLRVPKSTLDRWGHLGEGPKYTMVGRSARYDWADVYAWQKSQPSGGER